MPRSLSDIAADIAGGRTDAVRLVEEALARAEATPAVFITLMTDAALGEAHAARQRRRDGRPLGAFDGIPIGWKDLFDIAGTRTGAGSRTRARSPLADRDAAVVAATRRLGFIPLGKTNLSEFAFSGLGANPHFGTPLADLPVSEPRVPGGSSSGSAVAVQRGIVPVAIGTDTAGSVRVPAAFTGCVGYKASQGRYDMAGVFPLAASFDSLGPLATCLTDCIVMDAAMRGGRPSIGMAEAPPAIVIDDSLLDDPTIAPEVHANFEQLVASLVRAEVPVRRTRLHAWHAARDAIGEFGWLGAFEARILHLATIQGPDRSMVDPRVISRLDAAATMSADAAAHLGALRVTLRRQIADELGGAALALPTVKHAAPALAPLEADPAAFAQANLATLSLTMVGSFLDMPGVALPCGTSAEGLPLSALFARASGGDEGLLSEALWLERTIRRSPPIAG